MATPAKSRSVASTGPTPSPFRRDIQGLRALAVLIVFLDHMLGWPRGGFVGVDVFFVISGFLITGLLLREYERSGHISARKFYLSRAKRIFPAATLVLIVTVALAFALFTRQRSISVALDAVAAFFFTANWNFAISGTDYFAQGAATSPLQHYWSLSVEEQFYFVWPWLLLGLLALVARFTTVTRRKLYFIAGGSVGFIAVASFGWAVVQSVQSPTVAYFSTFTRAWELALGALLAVVATTFNRIPTFVKSILFYAGLGGIVAACFLIDADTVWPGAWALLPTLSSAAVIASGVGAPAPLSWPLTNPVSVYIGNISYSLYLWHFPVIVFGSALFPNDGLLTYMGISVAGFGLAIAAYHAVERPLWKAPLFSAHDRHAWRRWRAENKSMSALGATIGLGVASATLIAVSLSAVSPTNAVAEPYTPPVMGQPSSSSIQQGPGTEIRSAVKASLSASTWPTLIPSIDEIGPRSRVSPWVEDGCLALETKSEADFRKTTARCVYGDPNGTNTAVVVGDSIAISWLPAIAAALAERGWRIQVLTMHQCPYTSASVVRSDGSPHPDCDAFHDWTASEIQRLQPSLIIASQLDAVGERLTDGGDLTEFIGLTEDTLRQFAEGDRKVIVLTAPPPGVPLEECYTSTGSPSDCVTPTGGAHKRMTSALSSSVTQMSNQNVSFLDADFMFCSGDRCPAEVDGVVVRADGSHLTDAYSRRLGAPLGELLE